MNGSSPWNRTIGAVVLAAGLSSRMGRPKMVLPWGRTTIIGQVVSVLQQSGVSEIVVVTGGAQHELEAALQKAAVKIEFNPRYQEDSMVLSLQVGVNHLGPSVEAVLVALGDQPQIQVKIARSVIQAYLETDSLLVAPSYQRRRGHPWLVARHLWQDILTLQPSETLRTFFAAHHEHIYYLNVDDDSVLRDLDTPADYEREKPIA